jgi:hypothetical protein
MEPDHTAKYSLPVLTDLTENLIQKKNPTFYVLTPYSSEGVFGRVSAFCVHPCGLFFENSNIDAERSAERTDKANCNLKKQKKSTSSVQEFTMYEYPLTAVSVERLLSIP